MKKNCKSPNVWISGKRKPFKRGHCRKSKSPTGASKKKYCKSPNVWIPANRKTRAKGKCVTIALKSPRPISAKPYAKSKSLRRSTRRSFKSPKAISVRSRRLAKPKTLSPKPYAKSKSPRKY